MNLMDIRTGEWAAAAVAATAPWLRDELPPLVARALIEGQMMAMMRHSAWMGIEPTSIRATGGAAVNHEILQVMADVFGVPVEVVDNTGSAALGAALRAWQAHRRLPWPEVVGGFARAGSGTRIVPVPRNVTAYRTLQHRYIAMEHAALAGATLPRP